MRIASGAFDTALVMGHGHAEGPTELVSNVTMDPFFYRPLGMSATAALALEASSYSAHYGVSEGQAAAVAVKNRRQGVNNPYAHLRSAVTPDQVLASKVVAWPLRELDCRPESAGAVALVLCSEDRAKRIASRWATVKGIGWATSSYYIGATDLWRLDGLANAAKQAYIMAGISDPVTELDVAEVHDVTSYHELMAYEGMGWAQGGRRQPAARGRGDVDGRPSACEPFRGGAEHQHRSRDRARRGWPRRPCRLRGEQTGGRSKARTALAHGMSGLAGSIGQTHGVVILRGR